MRFHSLYHTLSYVVARCHSLSFIAPLFVLLVVTRCHFLYHSPFVVTRCTTRCHSLYHSLSLIVTRCTIHLPFIKRSSFIMESQHISSYIIIPWFFEYIFLKRSKLLLRMHSQRCELRQIYKEISQLIFFLLNT